MRKLASILFTTSLCALAGQAIASDILSRNANSEFAFNQPRKCTPITPCSDGSIGIDREESVGANKASLKPKKVSYSDEKINFEQAQLPKKKLNTVAAILEIADQTSHKYGVDKHLVAAIIRAESAFDEQATSPKKAKGLMQLMDKTAQRFNVSNAYDPAQNINGGVQYVKFLLERYKGNIVFAVAAYNAGEGAVDKYKGIPPYAETQNYVKTVLSYYHSFSKERGV